MLRHYLIWTWRTLAADRLTTCLNLLALSLGLVSFSLAVAAALFLRSNDAALPNVDRIYAITEHVLGPAGNTVTPTLPYSAGVAAKYMQADYPEIEAITVLSGNATLKVMAGGKSHMLTPVFFDESFTRIVKLPLRYGSPDQAFSQPRSAVLTTETAQRLFGNTDPVGQPLRIAGADVTVTGVLAAQAPPSIFRPSVNNDIDLLASRDVRDQVEPLMPEPEAWDGADGWVLVLLPEGLSPDGLRAKLAEFGPRHVQRLQRIYNFGLVPLTDVQKLVVDGFLNADRTGLSVPALLIALGGLVLFVACLNYANLASAKAIGRLPESGMKKVLGASRSNLLAQYLTESLILSIAAMVLVLLLLMLVAAPFARATGVDLHRLLFHRPTFWLLLLGGAAAATLLGGLYPAWLLSGPKAMAAALSGKVRQARSRLASVLVGLQFLAASFLLIMLGIVALQNGALRREAGPADSGALLVIDTPLDGQTVATQDVRNALRDVPSVQSVAGVSRRPWTLGSAQHRFFKDAGVKGQPVTENDLEVTEDYFTTLGSHLLAGRLFSPDRGGDFRPEEEIPTTSYNVVVDRGFVQAFGWTPEEAIGQNVWHYTLNGSAPVQIIGVIENQPQTLMSFGASGSVYNLVPKHARVCLVRLAPGADPATLAAIDRALIRSAPDVEWRHRFTDELFTESSEIFSTVIMALSGLALFAVVIALLGLVGMAIHTLNSRTEEIGIRKILGADHFVILRLLLWDISKPVLIAAIVSWPLAYIAGQIYLTLFTRRIALGPWPFAVSLAATLAVAWLAVGWRIASASVKSPAEVLRYE